MRFFQATLLFSLLMTKAHANEIDKLSCSEVETTEAQCKEYNALSKACDEAANAEIKNREQAAKKAHDDCKSKNGVTYALKCKDQIKEVTLMRNTPKKVSQEKIKKDLLKDPKSPCAQADEIGTAHKVCKAPAKVLEAMKRNCIK